MPISPDRVFEDHFDGYPIRTAPRDGTEILIRVIHPTARYYKDPVAAGYDAWCEAHWIDHNGGGFTWQGLYGTPVQWRPLVRPLSVRQPDQQQEQQ